MTTSIVDGYSGAMSPGASASRFSLTHRPDECDPCGDDTDDTLSLLGSPARDYRRNQPGFADERDADTTPARFASPRSSEPGFPESGRAGTKTGETDAYSRYAVLTPLGAHHRCACNRGGSPRSITTNVMALNAYRYNVSAEQILHQSLQRLSSGKRINSAADDASGLALIQGLKTQVLGNRQAIRNAQDGISLTQTAEGVLSTVHDMLQRMRGLAVQGANDTYSDSDRAQIGAEMDAIRVEIGRIGQATEAMGRRILGGKYVQPADALRFQIGANASDAEVIAITFVDVTDIAQNQLGHIPQDANHEAFQRSIENIDTQIQVISGARATLGAMMNRFEHTINNLNVSVENLSAARSRMQDADLAAESVNYMRGRILGQSSSAMLAQALRVPRGVMTLLSVA